MNSMNVTYNTTVYVRLFLDERMITLTKWKKEFCGSVSLGTLQTMLDDALKDYCEINQLPLSRMHACMKLELFTTN